MNSILEALHSSLGQGGGTRVHLPRGRELETTRTWGSPEAESYGSCFPSQFFSVWWNSNKTSIFRIGVKVINHKRYHFKVNKVKVAQSCLTLCDPVDYTVHGISRPEHWSFPSPGDLPNPGIEPRSPALQADSLPAEPAGKPKK